MEKNISGELGFPSFKPKRDSKNPENFDLHLIQDFTTVYMDLIALKFGADIFGNKFLP